MRLRVKITAGKRRLGKGLKIEVLLDPGLALKSSRLFLAALKRLHARQETELGRMSIGVTSTNICKLGECTGDEF